MQDSVFTKIIRGEIPCHKVYEDTQTIAFLSINPICDGHVLVVPKVQIDHLWDLPEADYQATFETARLVANRIREVMQPSRVGVRVEGLEVPHAHIHVFPFDSNEDFLAHPQSGDPDHAKLSRIAQQLAFSVQ